MTGRDAAERVHKLYWYVKKASATVLGEGEWTVEADHDANMAAQIAEAEWYSEGLTEAEAVHLMCDSKNRTEQAKAT